LSKIAATPDQYQKVILDLQDQFGDPVWLAQCYATADVQACELRIKGDRAILNLVHSIIMNLQSADSKFDPQLLLGQIVQKFSLKTMSRVYLELSLSKPELNNKYNLGLVLGQIQTVITNEEILNTQLVGSQEDSSAASSETISSVMLFSNKGKNKCPTDGSSEGNSGGNSKQAKLNYRRKFECAFGSLTHPSSKCKKFPSIPSRKEWLEELGHCSLCTSKQPRT